MKALLALSLICLLGASAVANVVRPAPDFAWEAAGGKARSLKSLRGQPVVLVVGKSADSRAFRRQVNNLKGIYQQFASQQVVFIAALKEAGGSVPSDVPFVTAANGGQVAAAYGITGSFALIVIGKDGNIDLVTEKVKSAARIRDVIVNSFGTQSAARP